jgi:hypothetical protein
MIYKLTRTGNDVGYDEYDAKIVRAGREQEARRIANLRTGDEGAVWDNPDRVDCVAVDLVGDSEEILGSFCAG